jgi:hypothetical protein
VRPADPILEGAADLGAAYGTSMGPFYAEYYGLTQTRSTHDILFSYLDFAAPPAAAAVPEASSVALVLSGGVGLAGYIGLQWRARRRK